ncbi:hypothetical protein R1T16_05630 [Flavobacterium sp. DG1-102-2]|uniref:hypothetical protein n=1 Tax=Flavobacterium sp. DG1-102-2 TaxID=3081663 RepID=UPI0029491D46|nr:hypothetical protein [Flavobacterium sp. DG1-102-2]MDV6167896.1 hypothetical protein [Flavobacterium sp. DG1-102-2]
MKKFDLEAEFQKYMKRMQLDLSVMELPELTERKRAFIAGVSQVFLFMKNKATGLNDLDAVAALEDIDQQLSYFWNSIKLKPAHDASV